MILIVVFVFFDQQFSKKSLTQNGESTFQSVSDKLTVGLFRLQNSLCCIQGS